MFSQKQTKDFSAVKDEPYRRYLQSLPPEIQQIHLENIKLIEDVRRIALNRLKRDVFSRKQ